MKNFPFKQTLDTKDCGYRCLYYLINTNTPYDKWLENFKVFNPKQNGIYLRDIANILAYYNIEYAFSNLSDKGLFLIYSGVWPFPNGLKGGHYFIYENEKVLCSLRDKPFNLKLNNLLEIIETKNIEDSFWCLKINA